MGDSNARLAFREAEKLGESGGIVRRWPVQHWEVPLDKEHVLEVHCSRRVCGRGHAILSTFYYSFMISEFVKGCRDFILDKVFPKHSPLGVCTFLGRDLKPWPIGKIIHWCDACLIDENSCGPSNVILKWQYEINIIVSNWYIYVYIYIYVFYIVRYYI